MRAFLRKIWEDKKGNSLVIAAATLPLLLGSAGLATDTIQWALWKRQLQRAADSAAIAGVYEYVGSQDNSTVGGAVNKDLALNNHTSVDLSGGYPQVSYPADAGQLKKQVKVTLAVQRKLSFSGMFMPNPPLIKTSATAASVGIAGEFCVVSLENDGNYSGITIGGSSSIEMDCGMISNSPSINSALSNGNSSKVKATVLAAVGGVQASQSWDIPSYMPYVPAMEDPYSSLPTPPTNNCSAFNEPGNKTNGTVDRRTDTGTICLSGDLTIRGDVKLGSATYVIDAGSLKMANNSAKLSCTGCTFVLTSSTGAANIGTIDMSGGTVNISAPTTGTYKGMAIYQDRRATPSNGTSKINGGSASQVLGSIYMPGTELIYNGDGTTTAVCTNFVTRRITFTGNNTTSNKFAKGSQCGAYGMPAMTGSSRVRLVA